MPYRPDDAKAGDVKLCYACRRRKADKTVCWKCEKKVKQAIRREKEKRAA